MTERRHYVFLNACDGGALPDVAVAQQYESDGDLTEAEARERALRIAEELEGFLVGAYRLEETFVAQSFRGVFVDRFGTKLNGVRRPKVTP